MGKKCFAAVRKDIVDHILNDIKYGLYDIAEPHYDDKALTLFLLLRFYAGCGFQFYTNELMLCELMNLSTRAENKTSIMSNILKMQEDDLLTITQHPNKKFFHIILDYESFMPENDFVTIYKEEFDALFLDKSRDKLLLVLYCIKKFQHKRSGISFPSVETIMDSSNISKPTVCKSIDKLAQVLDIYKAKINFNDGTNKEVNYYRSLCDGKMSEDQVANIAKKYYPNIKSITRKK